MADLQQVLATALQHQASLIQMSGIGILGPLLAANASRPPVPGVMPHPAQQVSSKHKIC